MGPQFKMKITSFLISVYVVTTSAFVSMQNSKHSFALNGFFDKVFDMDLFKDNPDVNSYGARSKKNLKVGKIGSNSYVPSGLSADQYNKIRGDEKNKRDQNYARNVAKLLSIKITLNSTRNVEQTQSKIGL